MKTGTGRMVGPIGLAALGLILVARTGTAEVGRVDDRPDRVDPRVIGVILDGLQETIDGDTDVATDTIHAARLLLNKAGAELTRAKGLLRLVEQILISPRPEAIKVREVGKNIALIVPDVAAHLLKNTGDAGARRRGVIHLRLSRLLAEGALVSTQLMGEVEPILDSAADIIRVLLPDPDARDAIEITRDLISVVRDPRIRVERKVGIVIDGTREAIAALHDVEIE